MSVAGLDVAWLVFTVKRLGTLVMTRAFVISSLEGGAADAVGTARPEAMIVPNATMMRR